MSVAFKLCKLRNNNIKFKPHDQLEPDIMKVNQMMFLASFWTSRGAPSSEVYQFLVSCIDTKCDLKEKNKIKILLNINIYNLFIYLYIKRSELSVSIIYFFKKKQNKKKTSKKTLLWISNPSKKEMVNINRTQTLFSFSRKRQILVNRMS